MNFYQHKNRWKVILLLFALGIGLFSILSTNRLVKRMETEERKNMEIWAEAQAALANTEDIDQNINFYLSIITKNTTIPVILVNENDSIITVRNLNKIESKNDAFKYRLLEKMKSRHEPIVINFDDGNKNFIYYDDSHILKQLQVYPFVQLGIITIFMLISYVAFSASRKAEQNRVWIGMSKETAHQLGTPISSLMAWVEILEQNGENKEFVSEMAKDIRRLQMIAERFSNVGSSPNLKPANLLRTLLSAINYMKVRVSKNVNFIINDNTKEEIIIPLNSSLFGWVIENLVKNAVDAMEGKGEISVLIEETDKEVSIEIKDTGKGISKSKQKTVFKPGYTSKDRGWGLGLSLAKRIIENYHKGKIFVKESEIDKGTTFKIVLPKG